MVLLVMSRVGQTVAALLDAPKGIIHLGAPVAAAAQVPEMQIEGMSFDLLGSVLRSFSNSREPVSTNPGNNLHVSGLSHKVDTRDLEQAFAKVGRVSYNLSFVSRYIGG